MTTAVRILGPTQVTVGGAEVTVRSTRKRRLLARLALANGDAVSADRLIAAVWGDDPPRTAAQALYVHLSQLRATLAGAGSPDAIATVADGYRLAPDVEVDAQVFDSLAEQGLEACAHGDVELGMAQLREALGLWADPCVELEDDPAAVVERHRLTAVHERVIDELHEHLVDAGGSPPPSLVALVAEGPLRERPHAQLARAHRNAGDPARAARVLRDADALFARELGAGIGRLLLDNDQPATASSDTASEIWRRIEQHLGRGVAALAGPDDDLGELFDALAGHADRALRPFLVTTMPPGPARPLALVDRLTRTHEPGLHHQPDRLTRHQTTTRRLERELGTGGVMVVDQAQRLDDASVDHLQSMLGGSRRASVSIVIVFRGSPNDELLSVCRSVIRVEGQPRIRRRLDAVPDTANGVLRILGHAVLPAPVEVIVRAARQPSADSLRGLDALTAHGVARLDAASRIELIESVPDDEPVETSIHAALAEAVCQTLPIDDPYRLVAEARHRVASTTAWEQLDPATVDALRRAARYLAGLGAEAEIATMLEAVPDVARHDLELGVALTRAAVRSGSPDAAETLERVLATVRTAGDGAAMAEVVRSMCEQRAPQTIDDATRSLIVEALDAAPADAVETRVQLLTDLAGSWYLDRADECLRLADEALALAQRAGGDGLVARALTGSIQARWGPDSVEDRLELAREAHERARRGGSTETQLLALTYEAAANVERGDLAGAGPPLAYAEALGTAIQVPRFRWWVAAWKAVLVFASGRLRDAEAGFDRALALWPTTERSDAFECYVSQIAAHRMLTGRSHEIAAAATEIAEQPGSAQVYRPVAAAARAMAGDLDEAQALLAPLVANGLPSRRDATHTTALVMTAEAAWLTGLSELGPALCDELAPLAHQHAVINVWGGGGFYWGAARHAHALALDLCERHGEARAEMLRASREQHDAGAAVFAERSRRAVADLGR